MNVTVKKQIVETFPPVTEKRGCRGVVPCFPCLVWNQLQEAVLLWIHQSQGLVFFVDRFFLVKDGDKNGKSLHI